MFLHSLDLKEINSTVTHSQQTIASIYTIISLVIAKVRPWDTIGNITMISKMAENATTALARIPYHTVGSCPGASVDRDVP